MKNKLLDIIGFINIILIIYIMIHSQINYVADILAFCISFTIFTFLFLNFFDDSSVVYLVELYAVTIVVLIILILKVFNKSYRLVLNNEIWFPGVYFSFLVYQLREFICKKKK